MTIEERVTLLEFQVCIFLSLLCFSSKTKVWQEMTRIPHWHLLCVISTALCELCLRIWALCLDFGPQNYFLSVLCIDFKLWALHSSVSNRWKFEFCCSTKPLWFVGLKTISINFYCVCDFTQGGWHQGWSVWHWWWSILHLKWCGSSCGSAASSGWENSDTGTRFWSTSRWCGRFVPLLVPLCAFTKLSFLVIILFLSCSVLQATDFTLDFRVTNLEDNTVASTNFSELETRVTQLEEISGEQETQITTNQENIAGNILLTYTGTLLYIFNNKTFKCAMSHLWFRSWSSRCNFGWKSDISGRKCRW